MYQAFCACLCGTLAVSVRKQVRECVVVSASVWVRVWACECECECERVSVSVSVSVSMIVLGHWLRLKGDGCFSGDGFN